MPIVTNQIGPHRFINLQGTPQLPQRMLSVLSRAGVSGVTLVDDGVRGTQYTLRSQVDQINGLTGFATYQQYLQLVGTVADLTWQDVVLATSALRVAVLGVRLATCIPLAASSSGGLNPPSLGWLECDWDLLTIDQVL